MNRVLVPDLAVPPIAPRYAHAVEFGGETMGTTWRVHAFAPLNFDAVAVEGNILALLDEIVQQMSPWVAGSNINRFNDAAPGSWHALPDHFRTVLDCALTMAEQTQGAFDPTLGALVDLWGFGAQPPEHDIPPERAIEDARAAAGWRKLARDGARVLQPGGVRLDLNGIAKGYAVDQVAALAAQAGLTSYLVEIGGELRGAGVKPDGQPWWVEIERPPQCDTPRTLAALCNVSIATSGDYRRNAIIDGKSISHTIDPRSGRPIDTGVASVAVLHASCMWSDAYTKALQVLGAEGGLAFANASNLPAMMISRTAGGFREHIANAAATLLADD